MGRTGEQERSRDGETLTLVVVAGPDGRRRVLSSLIREYLFVVVFRALVDAPFERGAPAQRGRRSIMRYIGSTVGG